MDSVIDQNKLRKNHLEFSNDSFSIGKLLIKTNDTIFNVIYDLLNKEITKETFTKENRLFYIGLSLIIISIILFILDLLND